MTNTAFIFQPKSACLTKFGPEAYETTDEILRRKEFERRSGIGLHTNEFWWGIGEKGMAESICHLIQRYSATSILFAPIQKQTPPDNSPSHVSVWRKYRTLTTHILRDIPNHILITSSISRIDGSHKLSHFALVCKTTHPIGWNKEGKFANCHYKNLKKSGIGYKLGSIRRGQRTTCPLVKHTDRTVSAAECDLTIEFSRKLLYP
jgi:hypothetical protein